MVTNSEKLIDFRVYPMIIIRRRRRIVPFTPVCYIPSHEHRGRGDIFGMWNVGQLMLVDIHGMINISKFIVWHPWQPFHMYQKPLIDGILYYSQFTDSTQSRWESHLLEATTLNSPITVGHNNLLEPFTMLDRSLRKSLMDPCSCHLDQKISVAPANCLRINFHPQYVGQ